MAYLFNVALKKRTATKDKLLLAHLADLLLTPLSALTSLILIRWSSCSANVSGAGPEQDDT